MNLNEWQAGFKNRLLALNPKRIFVAYSGGVDSSVLLHSLTKLQLDLPLFAIHIHHGLSPNADAWFEHCKETCEKLDIELLGHHVDLSGHASNIEQAARLARYEVFEQHIKAGDVLLMGHHQDDQIETFMMRLMRGSGLTGLTVMDEERPLAQGRLLRPLINISRLEIEAHAEQDNISHIEDESNTDQQFDRNWWRHELLPKIAQRYPQSSQSILKTIDVLQAEHALLNDLLQPIYQKMVDGQGRLDSNQLQRQSMAIQNQLVRKWLEQYGCYPLLADKQIRVLLEDVVSARDDAEPVFKWGKASKSAEQGNEVRRHNGKLYCMKGLPSIDVSPFPLAFNGTHTPSLPMGSLELNVGLGLKPDNYQIALYDGSAKARPINRPNKALKKWFQEYSVPPWQRPFWPIILKNEQVVAVPGLFVCQGFACEQGWRLSFNFTSV